MRRGTDKAPFYWVLALFVAGLSLAGYGGYVIYPRFDLPAAAGIGLLVLSIGAGVASFFSPCSFPLLVTLLARQAGSQRESAGQEASSSLPFAAALAAGASVFFLIAGIIVAFGGGALLEGVTFTSAVGRIIRVVVGGLLVILNAGFGWGIFGHLSIGKLLPRHHALGMGFLFGFNLPACAYPLLLVLLGRSVTSGAFWGFAALFVFGLALSLPILPLALSGSTEKIFARLSRFSSVTPYVTQVAP